MSEHLSHGPEKAEAPQERDNSAEKAERLKHLEKQAAEAQKEAPKIEAIRSHANQEAILGKEVFTKAEQHHDAHRHNQAFANRELKDMAYKRTLVRIRKQLSVPDRLSSRIMHQPLIEKISETTSTTVARPSGILGGGILAFLGTSAYYYITKHYGYEYNFFVFLFLLSLGFLLGWAIELIWNSVRLRNQ